MPTPTNKFNGHSGAYQRVDAEPKTNQAKTQKSFNKTELKGRGWTEAMIKRFLPEPDATSPNPCYKKAPPMKLYSAERVECVEGWGVFRECFEKAKNRKRSALRAVETKKTRLTEYIKELKVEVETMSFDTLKQKAIDHYNTRQEYYAATRNILDDFFNDYEYYDHRASLGSDADFLDRIMVNYLRHQESDYEFELYKTAGKVGVREAYVKIKHKVLTEIMSVYPQLKQECERQMEVLERKVLE